MQDKWWLLRDAGTSGWIPGRLGSLHSGTLVEPSLLSNHYSWALVSLRAFLKTLVSKKPSAILFFIVHMRVLTLKTQTVANIKILGYLEYTINFKYYSQWSFLSIRGTVHMKRELREHIIE